MFTHLGVPLTGRYVSGSLFARLPPPSASGLLRSPPSTSLTQPHRVTLPNNHVRTVSKNNSKPWDILLLSASFP